MRNPSTTSELCTFARAYHSRHGNRQIFDDYLAYELLGEGSYRSMERLIACEGCGLSEDSDGVAEAVCPWLNRHLSPILLARAAFAERALQVFAERHDPCQYVICGAGMDTFAFRNGNAGIRVFELDHPLTQARKEERVASLSWGACSGVRFVGVDFKEGGVAAALEAAGFDRSMPAFFSILGVAYYIALPELAATLAEIAEVATPGSELVIDYPDESSVREAADLGSGFARLAALVGEPMHGGYDAGELADALSAAGFDLEVDLAPSRVQALFFDGREDGQNAVESVHLLKAKVHKRKDAHVTI